MGGLALTIGEFRQSLHCLLDTFSKIFGGLMRFNGIYSAGPKLRIWPIFPKFLAQNLEYGILRGETPELRIWPTTKKVTLAVRNILSLLPTFVQVRFYIFKYFPGKVLQKVISK